MIFDNFPYTNFHEMNLDWILHKVQELAQEMTQFTEENMVRYHDPIAWNITTQYERNVIVKDPNTGVLYISKKPVPQGISLTNTDYWIEIGDLSYDIAFLKDSICPVDEGTSLTATQAYSNGDFIWWMDKLYVVTATINVGDAFDNNNLREVNIVGLLNDLADIMVNNYNDFQSFVNDINPATLYANTEIQIFGDSNTVPNYITESNRWYATVANALGCTYSNHGVSNTCWQDNVSDGGGGYRGNFRTQINAQTYDESVKLVMICGGINDYHYGTFDISSFSQAVSDTISAAHAKYPNAVIVSFMDCGSQEPNGKLLQYAKAVMRRGTCSTNTSAIMGIAIPTVDMCSESGFWYNTNHYSQQGHNQLARRILTALIGNGMNGYAATYSKSADFTQASPTSTGFYNCGWLVQTRIDPVLCTRDDDLLLYINPSFANTDSRSELAANDVIFNDVPVLDCIHGRDSMTKEYLDALAVRSSSGTIYYNPVPLTYVGNNYDQVTESPKMTVQAQYKVQMSDLNARTRVRLHFQSN